MSKNNISFISYYNQFKDKIYNYFFYRVGADRFLAEDMTSEVFIKAFKNFSEFDENKKFQPWIYAIAHNHLVNYYRASKTAVPLEEVVDFLPDLNNHAEIRYELGRVLRLIEDLPENEREVLKLKFIDGLSGQEIASVVGREEGAVRTQISRSLHSLRGTLKSQNSI